MAENQGNDLEVRIGADVSGFEAGANSAVKTLDQFSKKAADASSAIDKNAEAISRATQKTIDSLTRRYDPIFAAQERYKKAIAEIATLEKLTGPSESTERAYQNAFAQRTNAIQRVIGANNTLIASNDAVAASSRRFGFQVQQVGFQVGDFFTQVASGQGVLRPLIQQGSQLVSGFGIWGAVLGAAGAAVGALAVSLGALGDETEDAKKAQDDFIRSMEDYYDILAEVQGLQEDGLAKRVRETQGIIAQKAAQDELNAARLEEIRQRQVIEQLSALGGGFQTPGQAAADVGAANAAIDKQKAESEAEAAKGRQKVLDLEAVAQAKDLNKWLDEQLGKLKEQGEVTKAVLDAQGAAFDDAQKQQDEADKKAEARAKIVQQYDADRAAQQDKDRAAAFKRGEEIIAQDKKQAASFEKYLAGEEQKTKLLGLSVQQRQLETALMEAQRQKGAQLTEAEKQRVAETVKVSQAYKEQQALSDELERSFERAFDRIGTAITQMFVEGKASALDFRNVALAVVSEIAQEFIKLAAINPLKNAIFGTNSQTLANAGGLLGDLFNPVASNADFFGSSVVPEIHSGGVVGSDSMRMRTVANDTFHAAPRFHSGLMPDEFPAILQKGEGVFTQAQMKALGDLRIEIIDQRGANAPPIEQEVMTDGRVRLLIREAAPSIVRASVAEMENRQRRGIRA